MPADQTLLILCVALTLVGLVGTVLAWRRGRRGRVVQGLGFALLPVALYLTGLLQLVFDFVVSIVRWAARIVFSPTVWLGLSLLGLCVVLFVVGGIVARHSPSAKELRARKAERAEQKAGGTTRQVAGRPAQPVTAGRKTAPASRKQQSEVDPEMAEIEALLKSRGIE